MAQQQRPAKPQAWYIVEAWKDWLMYEHMTIDKPYCFACGKSATWKGEKSAPDMRWNYSRGLEKAHIVPFSKNGSNEPDNFFLLCKYCHTHAPTTIYKDDFLKWAEQQSEFEREYKQLQDEINTFLPDKDEQEQFAKWHEQHSQEEITRLLKSRKEEYISNWGSFPRSTYIAMLVRIWRERKANSAKNI